jgi:lipoprotein-anchoring transpeptidase ErfK/SrfK
MVPRAALSLAAAAAAAAVVAPSAQLMPAIAPGVTLGGVRLGGLTSEPARARVERSFARPLVVVRGSRHVRVFPDRLGAALAADKAVSAALRAREGVTLGVPVRLRPRPADRELARVARTFRKAPVPSRLLGLTGNGRPLISRAVPGVAVRRGQLRLVLLHSLRSGARAPLPLPTRPVEAQVTRDTFGPVIVIDRGANTLRLFDATRLVRGFQVATGQSRYPTPSGTFRIVTKQRDPWWYPPDSDWAQGLSPIPPGPGNPLGTRWMGLSVTGVGIHGTPSDASIGYSASHGCIRMHIPEAAWLFEHVAVGTPVVIV